MICSCTNHFAAYDFFVIYFNVKHTAWQIWIHFVSHIDVLHAKYIEELNLCIIHMQYTHTITHIGPVHITKKSQTEAFYVDNLQEASCVPFSIHFPC